MSCILKLNQIYSTLTDVDKKIADYITNNKGDVCKMRVSELANECGASTASIVRFCKKVGYEGFSEFKIELAKDKSQNEEIYESTYIDESSSLDRIIDSISEKNAQTIYQSVKLNKNENIKAVVDYIINSKNVYIFGLSGSSLVAQDFQMKLVRINKNAITFIDTHMQIMSSNNIDKSDVAIGISYSGESKEILASMKKAKEKGATCVAITKFGESSLTNICNVNLYVPSVEKSIREGAISSRIAMLTLIDIIYLAVMQHSLKENEEKIVETRDLVKLFK